MTRLTLENLMHQAAHMDQMHVPMPSPVMTVDTGPADYLPVERMQFCRSDVTRLLVSAVSSTARTTLAPDPIAFSKAGHFFHMSTRQTRMTANFAAEFRSYLAANVT